MTELKQFIKHMQDEGHGGYGFKKEIWLSIVDFFYKKEIEKTIK